MAPSSAVRKLREEATCSICLQLMTEPMSIHCGHSFCRWCIESILENQQVTPFPRRQHCPMCRKPFQRESLRPNKQLENLIETIKEMDHEKLCDEHGEQLQLFCEDDGQLICWRCEWSPLHNGHNMALVEDVCPGYKDKLQATMKNLKKLQAHYKSAELFERKQITEWQENIEIQRQKIQGDFRNLHNFLYEEEKCYLWRLEKEKEQVLRKLQDGKASLERKNLELESRIQEIEKKCQESAQNLLQNVKDIIKRNSDVKLELPEILSLQPQTGCNISELYFDVKKIFKSCHGMMLRKDLILEGPSSDQDEFNFSRNLETPGHTLEENKEEPSMKGPPD